MTLIQCSTRRKGRVIWWTVDDLHSFTALHEEALAPTGSLFAFSYEVSNHLNGLLTLMKDVKLKNVKYNFSCWKSRSYDSFQWMITSAEEFRWDQRPSADRILFDSWKWRPIHASHFNFVNHSFTIAWTKVETLKKFISDASSNAEKTLAGLLKNRNIKVVFDKSKFTCEIQCPEFKRVFGPSECRWDCVHLLSRMDLFWSRLWSISLPWTSEKYRDLLESSNETHLEVNVEAIIDVLHHEAPYGNIPVGIQYIKKSHSPSQRSFWKETCCSFGG